MDLRDLRDVIVVENAEGLEDLPERVLNLLGQTEDPPFLRRNADDETTGDYVFSGDANGGGTITFPVNAAELF